MTMCDVWLKTRVIKIVCLHPDYEICITDLLIVTSNIDISTFMYLL